MKNPYQTFGADRFWRTGVANRAAYDTYGALWKPKIPFTRQSKIVAAGSCFAQHVGRWLTYNEFDFKASALDDTHNFSFATGNIYTPALLKQWFEAATGAKALDHVYEEKGGRFYDLLRPSVQADGFETLQQLQESRAETLEEMLTMIKSADVLIFTLGLTEAWGHRDGTVYPMCPGTIAGTYDPNEHHFKNFNHAETLEAMTSAMEIVRSVNDSVSFLLTVSPVPLTATAADDHVLKATTYSKSVLRAVAGDLASQYDDVDYFASYELITTHPDNKEFFEVNRRSVTPTGVSFVMAHLEASLSGAEAAATTVDAEHSTVSARELIEPRRKVYSNEEAVCEEIYLDQWNRVHKLDTPPRYCLIGDSQMAMLSNILEERAVPYIGGMIMNGSSWGDSRFYSDEEEFFVPLESKLTRSLWTRTLEQLEQFSGDEYVKPIIVTNLGQHIRASLVQMWHHINEVGTPGAFDMKDIMGFVKSNRARHLLVLKSFVKAGYQVLMVTDPPLQQFYDNANLSVPLSNIYEKIYQQVLLEEGIACVNMRDVLEASPEGIQENMMSSIVMKSGERDMMHGSYEYYCKVADAVMTATSEELALAG